MRRSGRGPTATPFIGLCLAYPRAYARRAQASASALPSCVHARHVNIARAASRAAQRRFAVAGSLRIAFAALFRTAPDRFLSAMGSVVAAARQRRRVRLPTCALHPASARAARLARRHNSAHASVKAACAAAAAHTSITAAAVAAADAASRQQRSAFTAAPPRHLTAHAITRRRRTVGPNHTAAAPASARRLCAADARSNKALASRHRAAHAAHRAIARDWLRAHRATAARSHKLTAAAPPAHTPNARAMRRAASRPRARPFETVSAALAAAARRSATSAARWRDIAYHLWHSMAFDERKAVASTRAAPTALPASMRRSTCAASFARPCRSARRSQYTRKRARTIARSTSRRSAAHAAVFAARHHHSTPLLSRARRAAACHHAAKRRAIVRRTSARDARSCTAFASPIRAARRHHRPRTHAWWARRGGGGQARWGSQTGVADKGSQEGTWAAGRVCMAICVRWPSVLWPSGGWGAGVCMGDGLCDAGTHALRDEGHRRG